MLVMRFNIDSVGSCVTLFFLVKLVYSIIWKFYVDSVDGVKHLEMFGWRIFLRMKLFCSFYKSC